MTCPVPTSRLDEIVRDAEAPMRKLHSRLWRGVVSLLAAGFAAVIANEVSENGAWVLVATMAGLSASWAVIWAVPLYRAWRDPKRRKHWRSQVYQAAPDASVEFDLWSECDHEIAAVRADVVEPDGRMVPSELTIPVPGRHVEIGDYRGVGNYPERFVGARPLVAGSDYEVVWHGKRTDDSPWMELARQRFSVPLTELRIVQERDRATPGLRCFSRLRQGT